MTKITTEFFLELLILAIILVAVCASVLEHKTPNPNTPSVAKESVVQPATEQPKKDEPRQEQLSNWLGYFYIEQCDDGMFQVRSEHNIEARFHTLEVAREVRTNLALYMVEQCRKHRIESEPIPACGKRVE